MVDNPNANLTPIYQAINAMTQAIGNLQNLLTTFPRTTASSSAAPGTAGTISFSSSLATGFVLFQTSSGATVKLPYYSNP